VVLLALPFSILRSVDIQVELPAFKRKAIDELGYGTNTKVMIGTSSRIWRDQGFNGGIYTDELFQLGWDSSRLQAGVAGGYTFYSGGALGVEAGKGKVSDQVQRLLPGLEAAYPGISNTLNGKQSRFFWPGHSFSRGSYAAYKPGQWTTIAGAEIVPVGGLYFAGEHCSYDYQGYMNGAAETGRRAAEAIIGLLGSNPAV
jgi:monoamine oxidase